MLQQKMNEMSQRKVNLTGSFKEYSCSS